MGENRSVQSILSIQLLFTEEIRRDCQDCLRHDILELEERDGCASTYHLIRHDSRGN